MFVLLTDAFADSGSLNKNQAPSQKVMTCNVDSLALSLCPPGQML